jgi:glycosyltransferase involved in cell wall biosynthesis
MSRPLKILHYIPTYAPAWKFGGPILSVSQLCEGLVDLGQEIEVFTSNAGLENHPEIPLNQPIDRNGVKVTYFEQQPGMGIHCPGMEEAVNNRVKEFDLLHVTGVWQRTSAAACNAAHQQQVPYIVSPRGALGPYSWGQKTLKKLLYYLWKERFNVSNAAGVHYTSQQELIECQWLRLPGEPILVPNGINTNFWQPDVSGAKAWREANNLTVDDFILLNVGRLHHKKGLDLLPQVLANLQDLSWQMVFVGGDDDGTKANLERQFNKFNLLDRVRFIDRCEPQELLSIYTAANLFLLPSHHENFGNVAVEALACGCPIMISDRVGLHQEISQANMGWVLPRIASQWTEKIRSLIEHPNKLDEIASRSNLWVNSIFSANTSAQTMLQHYTSIIVS